MNHNDQIEAADVEARLERSLRRQIKAPRLDGRFDTAIWARIAGHDGAAQHKAVSPGNLVASGAPKWLLASNLIGIAVAILLMVLCAVRAMSGVELPSDLGFSMPSLSAEQQVSVLTITGAIFSVAALAFGLMFTKIGRWLRSEFR